MSDTTITRSARVRHAENAATGSAGSAGRAARSSTSGAQRRDDDGFARGHPQARTAPHGAVVRVGSAIGSEAEQLLHALWAMRAVGDRGRLARGRFGGRLLRRL